MDVTTALKAIDDVEVKLTKYRDSFVDTENFDYQKNALLTESLQKLKKLRYILEQCYIIDSEVNMLPALIVQQVFAGKGNTEHDQKLVDGLLQLEVYCEAFYYTAFRIYKIFEELKIRFKSIGVRDVRNHLIEHPEVLSQSFGTGNAGNGPTIKNTRQQDAIPRKKDEMDVFQDKGLFTNYSEFIDSLDKKLDTLINENK